MAQKLSHPQGITQICDYKFEGQLDLEGQLSMLKLSMLISTLLTNI